MRLLAVLISVVWLCCQPVQAQVRNYDEMIAAGELKVAVYKDFAPYSFEDAGQPRGVDVELAQALAKGDRSELAVQGRWSAPALAGVSPALAAALEANKTASQPATTGNTAAAGSLWAALLGGLIGGLILNLMPCVFPVLAIKVIGFARHGSNRRAHRLAGLSYTAGVVLSFVALGGLLLALRAAGEQLGWGFQLQSPAVVAESRYSSRTITSKVPAESSKKILLPASLLNRLMLMNSSS